MAEKKDWSPRNNNGPLVGSGPTYGKNRSRNSNGIWRRKRSDAGQPRKKSGCFLTTAACNYKGLSDDCAELTCLRQFRDGYLASTADGAAMIDHYYAVAPIIADHLVEPNDFEEVWGVVHRCVQAIQAGNHERAIHIYRDMVLALEQRFLTQRPASV